MSVVSESKRPSVEFGPRLLPVDGQFIAMFGDGVVTARGKTPDEAMRAFDIAWGWKPVDDAVTTVTPAAPVAQLAAPVVKQQKAVVKFAKAKAKAKPEPPADRITLLPHPSVVISNRARDILDKLAATYTPNKLLGLTQSDIKKENVGKPTAALVIASIRAHHTPVVAGRVRIIDANFNRLDTRMRTILLNAPQFRYLDQLNARALGNLPSCGGILIKGIMEWKASQELRKAG